MPVPEATAQTAAKDQPESMDEVPHVTSGSSVLTFGLLAEP